MLDLTFYGAAGTVTGSCYLLDTGNYRVMIDCGLFQESKELKERNYATFPFNPAQIDALLLTHAHIDHSGLIPKLFKQGYRGPVIATPVTRELCSVLLPDSAYIQEMEVERKNRKLLRAGKLPLEPIYTVDDAWKCLPYFQPLDYYVYRELAPGIQVRFQDAGHILGSAIIELWVTQPEGTVKIVFSGDLGKHHQPIVKDPRTITEADYVVMESTYGNRDHQEYLPFPDQLNQVIKETFSRGGNVVIPAFAVERSQDLLYYLNLLIQRGDLSAKHIYLDSPLAVAATEIFCRHQEHHDLETKALSQGGTVCPFVLPGLQLCRSTEESVAINQIKNGAIIISASGMCDAGRIKHHLKHNLWRPESTVVFVGYQAKGTLGSRLLEGASKVRIHGEEIAVKARIVNLEGVSAHAGRNDLFNWVQSFQKKPECIYVTHGEPESAKDLAALISQELAIKTIVPGYLDRHSLKPTVTRTMPRAATAAVAAQAELSLKQLQENLQAFIRAELDQGNYDNALEILQKCQDLLQKRTSA
jgi:metallo-beta-lactamase family protein